MDDLQSRPWSVEASLDDTPFSSVEPDISGDPASGGVKDAAGKSAGPDYQQAASLAANEIEARFAYRTSDVCPSREARSESNRKRTRLRRTHTDRSYDHRNDHVGVFGGKRGCLFHNVHGA